MTSNVASRKPPWSLPVDASVSVLKPSRCGVGGEHVVDVAREERRLVAAGAGPQLDDDVALVVGVALDERQAQLLLDRRERLLAGRELGLEVGAHLGIRLALEHPARVGDALAGGTPARAERRLLAQLLVPPPELRHALQVGRDRGIGELALDLRERLLDLRDQLFHRREA